MKDLYFSHDQNAANDNKILDLRGIYKMEGYGVYWVIIEALFKKQDSRLPYTDRTFGGLYEACHPSFGMKEFIDTCIDIGLFESDNEYFWSNSLIRRKRAAQEGAEARSQKGEKAAAARWGSRNAQPSPQPIPNPAPINKEAMQTQCSSNAQASNEQCSEMPIKNKNNTSASGACACACEEDNILSTPVTAAAYCEQNLMSMSSGNFEDLREFLEDGFTDEMIIMAVDEATAQGARTWAYVRTILNRWMTKGLKTAGDVKADQAKHLQRKEQSHSPPRQRQDVPEQTPRELKFLP